MSTYVLNSGNKIPKIGLGVFLAPKEVTENVVYHALKVGYRHIDCANITIMRKKPVMELLDGLTKILKTIKGKMFFIQPKYMTKIMVMS